MARLSTIKASGFYPPTLYCPGCRSPLRQLNEGYFCQSCVRSFPIIDGIPSFVNQHIAADSFDASTFDFLFQMEQKHFWHVGRREIILDVIERNVPKLQNIRMLEIGCGNGSVLAFLKQNGIDIEGGDIFFEGLRFCRQRVDSVPLYQLDVLALPFSREFDMIGLFDVLEHIENDKKALAEIKRALKGGGNLILTVPAHKFLWSRHDEASHHRRRYGRMELIVKLECCGFTVNKVTYYMFFLFPVLAIMRLLSKIFRNKKHEKQGIQTSLELKKIPVINSVFLAFLRLEKYLIRYLNIPSGASLLVIATRKDGKE